MPLQTSKSRQFGNLATSFSTPVPEGDNRISVTMKVRQNLWLWMAAAFCVALGLAIGVVAEFGANSEGFHAALRATARLNLLLFWPAYVGGALTTLFGKVFAPLSNNSRNFGLAFAAALSVHLGLVGCLCATGNVPDAKTFIVFGAAAAFVYLLAFLSIPRVRRALPDRFWPLVRALAMNYIALAFIKDFARPGIASFRDLFLDGTGTSQVIIMYVPFAALAVLGPMLRLAAWIRKPRQREAEKLSHPPASLILNLHMELSQFMCGRGIREGLGTGANGLVAGQKLRARSRLRHCGRPPIFEAGSRASDGRLICWGFQRG